MSEFTLQCDGLDNGKARLRMISELFFERHGTTMLQRNSKTLFQLMLVVAVGLQAAVPAASSCADRDNICRSATCCCGCCKGAGELPSTCCSGQSTARVCRCSKEGRPVAPPNRSSDMERAVLYQDGAASLSWCPCDASKPLGGEDFALRSFLPRPCRQALLGCWLI